MYKRTHSLPAYAKTQFLKFDIPIHICLHTSRLFVLGKRVAHIHIRHMNRYYFIVDDIKYRGFRCSVTNTHTHTHTYPLKIPCGNIVCLVRVRNKIEVCKWDVRTGTCARRQLRRGGGRIACCLRVSYTG